jgi:hypothetical protein
MSPFIKTVQLFETGPPGDDAKINVPRAYILPIEKIFMKMKANCTENDKAKKKQKLHKA